MRVLVLFAVLAGALVSASAAAADAAYHSEHMELSPVAGAPLRSGFVENIHPNGPKVYARERYVLNGAGRNAEYEVRLLVHLFDATCSNAPVLFSATGLATNGAGNGTAQLMIRPEDVPPAVRNATHGVRWEVWQGGRLAYRTACTSVTLD
jgi:hypothetical protein